MALRPEERSSKAAEPGHSDRQHVVSGGVIARHQGEESANFHPLFRLLWPASCTRRVDRVEQTDRLTGCYSPERSEPTLYFRGAPAGSEDLRNPNAGDPDLNPHRDSSKETVMPLHALAQVNSLSDLKKLLAAGKTRMGRGQEIPTTARAAGRTHAPQRNQQLDWCGS